MTLIPTLRLDRIFNLGDPFGLLGSVPLERCLYQVRTKVLRGPAQADPMRQLLLRDQATAALGGDRIERMARGFR